MSYERSIDLSVPFEDAVSRTRAALQEQGFGVLSEIDVQATLRDKRGLEMEPYLILGACNPDLAHQALEIDRSIGVLLPCNVVVSGHAAGSRVQILDPQIMASLTGLAALQPVADEASARLEAVLDTLSR
ncbi:MAG: DUF302 domain-containing protein [Nocardioides sp.]|nr:DUF302 domain-containing protein [Nocardioides sp.]